MTGCACPLRVRTRSGFPVLASARGTVQALSGTSGLRFRAIADMSAPSRHNGKSTANAVGW
jgi:hypothetical protein